MIFLKAMLGAILGGIGGCLLLIFALYPLFLAAEGGRDINGGIAMGMVTGVAPLGTLLGAILGVTFVVVHQRRKAMGQPSIKPGTGKTIMISLFALVAGYFTLLLILQGPSGIALDTKPDILLELRTTQDSVPHNDPAYPSAYLFNHRDETRIPLQSQTSVSDGNLLISVRFTVTPKAYDKQIRVDLSPKETMSIIFPFYPKFEVMRVFNKWDGVDYIHYPQSGDVEAGYSQEKHEYRYRAIANSGG